MSADSIVADATRELYNDRSWVKTRGYKHLTATRSIFRQIPAKTKGDAFERAIDDAVFKLYDLTPEEIKLVEGS